jgi:hypothetical protein
MRLVHWIDKDGYDHQSLVRDKDPDSAAPKGIRQDPPDMNQVDWEAVKLELHNALIANGLITWKDVQLKGNGVTGVILAVLRRRLVELYRERGVVAQSDTEVT